MENRENKNLQGRREFFKEAAKKTLPIIGVITMANMPSLVHATTHECHCSGGCGSSCKGHCESSCYADCENTCKGGCEEGCAHTCLGSCYGDCKRTCQDTCIESCKNHIK